MAIGHDYIQANTNGRLHDAQDASLSPLDRGFLYGDAVYEVWRTYEGILFAVDEHWERLSASAAGLGLTLPLDLPTLLAEILRTVAAFRERTHWIGELYVRLQISRGGGPIGLDPALAGSRANWVILVKPLVDLTESELDTGLRVALASAVRRNDARTLPPSLKTGNYLNNVLALREALAAGAQEVLMVNIAGRLTEGSVRNFWFVDKDTALTPRLEEGLLAGVTRRILFEKVALIAGLHLVEAALTPDDLPRFSECFATSTTQDIAPVGRLGSRDYMLGSDTATRKLKVAFRDWVKIYNQKHPQYQM
ncbi:MAG TPA: aminotransferase class IV [Opitutales bacterium]|jgi:branched-chain amino acid aminotransferase|nr:aminotransferase class IV [Opitutales bacterium]